MHKIAEALLAYGLWGVMLLSVIDSAGIPIPSGVDFLVVTIAASSAKAPRYAYFVALLAVFSSTVGNIVLFMAARHGRRLVSKSEPAPGKGKRFQQWFDRYGLLSVFVPAVTPVVPLPLKVFVVSAGALRTPVGRFVAVVVLARIIRYFGEAWLGIQLGEDAKGFLIRNGWTIAGVAMAATLALVFLVRLKDRRPVL
jgi:membrane protein YqaA with SNARE-associated domain